MAQKNLNPGTAPVKWSTVNKAFQDINDNFTELYNSVSFSVDPSNLGSKDSKMYSTGLDNDYSNTRSLQGQPNKFAYFPYAKNVGFKNKSGLR